jgi:tetratricopeptide (TPR) repeat protein
MNRPHPRTFHGLLLSILLLVTAVLVVFGRVGGHEFLIYDDETHLAHNPRFNPVTWRNVGQFWVERSYWGLYIPLSYTFFAAEALLARRPAAEGTGWELDPTVFHLGNLALHLACVLLVFAILRRLFRRDGAACAGALLFALHPVQVESVAWISETRGLLCAMFSLLAIWQFDLWAGRGSKSERSATLFYAVATTAFVLALLSKPAAVAVPLIAAALALGLSQRPLRRVLWGLGPWLVVAAGWVVLTKLQQPSGRMAFVPPLWARPLIAGDALAFYLYELAGPLWYVLGLIRHLLLVPWYGLEPLWSWASPHLYGPDYGRAPAWVIQQWWFYLTWLLPAGLLVVLAWLRNRRVWLSAAGVFLAWLLPVLGLLPFDFQRISTVADRYLYLSLLGPALALAWFLAQRWNARTIAASASLLGLFAVLSFVQTAFWRDNANLIALGLRVNPRSVLAKNHRGTLLDREGKHTQAIECYRDALKDHPEHEETYLSLAKSWVALGRVDEAEKALREALNYIPRRPAIHYELAKILSEQGRTVEAEAHYRQALALDRDFAQAYLDLGKLRFERGATDEAIGLYRRALEVAPYYVEAHVNLAAALETQHKVDEALYHYREALRIRPDWPEAHFDLANLLGRHGASEAAEQHYRAALEDRPNYAKAHVELGILLFARGATGEAIRHYQQALRTDPKLVPAHVNLGHALAAQGRRAEAAAEYRAALRLVPPDSVEAKQIRQFLRPYEDR